MFGTRNPINHDASCQSNQKESSALLIKSLGQLIQYQRLGQRSTQTLGASLQKLPTSDNLSYLSLGRHLDFIFGIIETCFLTAFRKKTYLI